MYRVTRRCYLCLIAGRVESNPFLESGNEPRQPLFHSFSIPISFKRWLQATGPFSLSSRGIHGPLAPILYSAGPLDSRESIMYRPQKKVAVFIYRLLHRGYPLLARTDRYCSRGPRSATERERWINRMDQLDGSFEKENDLSHCCEGCSFFVESYSRWNLCGSNLRMEALEFGI